jgi:class 3 adenylate cyclase
VPAATPRPAEPAPRQHPVTLAFADAALEAAYRRQTADGVRPWYRRIWLIGVLGFAAAWFLDPHTVGTPANGAPLQLARLAIGAPLLALVAAFGWAPDRWFRRAWAPVALAGVAVMIVVPVCSVFWMPAPQQVDIGTAAVSFIALLVFGLVFVPVGFVPGAVAAVAVLAAVTVVGLASGIGGQHGAVVAWAWASGAMGVVGARIGEQRHRREFVTLRQLAAERARAEALLRNVLPDAIAARLEAGERPLADSFDDVTVLFADLSGFTPLAASLPAEQVVVLLDEVFSRFDALTERHGLEKIKTIGDAYLAVAGLPAPRPDHAAAAAALALALRDSLDEVAARTGVPLRLRQGLCSGPAVAGVIGLRKFTYDLWGDTVNTAARMESHGLPGEIQVTESTWRLLQDGHRLVERGVIEVKGKGPMRTWLLAPRDREQGG